LRQRAQEAFDRGLHGSRQPTEGYHAIVRALKDGKRAFIWGNTLGVAAVLDWIVTWAYSHVANSSGGILYLLIAAGGILGGYCYVKMRDFYKFKKKAAELIHGLIINGV
jgi:hypothetical protein